MEALIIAEAAAILLLGVLVAGLLRSHAEILRRLHRLGAGLEEPGDLAFDVSGSSPAYDLSGVTTQDEAVGIRVVGAAHPTLVAFLSSGCLACADFWRAFADPDRLSLPKGTRLVVVTKDPEEESLSEIHRLAPSGAPLVMSSRAWQDYGVPGSPYVVLVDGPSGRVIGEGSGASWGQVEQLLGQATADAAPAGRGGADRAARVDRELRASGIDPGHPSLYEQEGR